MRLRSAAWPTRWPRRSAAAGSARSARDYGVSSGGWRPTRWRLPSETGRASLHATAAVFSERRSMRAVCWYGRRDVRVEQVTDPEILNPRDAIVRVTLTAICGSDLHLWNGVIPTMREGDILGHEFMGEVVDVGRGVRDLSRGDRVVVPFPIACGTCFFCREGLTSLCDNSNPNAEMAEALYGFSASGLFGYSHLYGGYAGGTGRARSRAVRRRGPSQAAGAGQRRAGAVPVRRVSDRLHGRGVLRHPRRGHRGSLGRRAGRPVR